MYISSMELENFRCYSGKTKFKFCSSINYFVGNNNCGKTTIFKAIDFLISGNSIEGWISKNHEKENVSVTIILRDDNLQTLLDEDNLKKYHKYIIDNNQLKLRRSSKNTFWTDSKGKQKNLTIKNIGIYNPKTEKFENPTGIDKMISALFDVEIVYSDIDNDEYQDFRKTKLLGKLISDYTQKFQKSDTWKNFEEAYNKAFGSEGIKGDLKNIETNIEEIMKDQYGKTGVDFIFDVPAIDSFFKEGQVFLEDNGIDTPASEKGTGMQRALSLSIIQLYAKLNNVAKPTIFLIDEPETYLHPKAQDKLLQSLSELSEKSQIFVTTHSPYLLTNFDSSKDNLTILSKSSPKITEGKKLDLFPYSPTWGEINYFAFDMASIEFHIELFELLKSRVASVVFHKPINIKDFDCWLAKQKGCIKTDEEHKHKYKKYTDKTMTCYIRNCIDHPDSGSKSPSTDEIKSSIEFMLNLYEKRLNQEKSNIS